MTLVLFICILMFSLTSAFLYKLAWNLSPIKNQTATGFGVLLVFFIIIYTFYLHGPIFEILIFSIIGIFSLIYWLDDISYLSSIFRFILQFTCGSLIAISFFISNNYELSFSIIIFIVVSGLINIFLSNTINFYDGLDLNISTLNIILALILVFLLDTNILEIQYGVILCGFVIGFSFFNFKPENIFYGDSGCFVIACYVNYLIIKSIFLENYNAVYLLIPFALPIIDVIYVVILRIWKKESLLSRNYYHLYHQIQLKINNKIYILPQVINAAALYVISVIIFDDEVNKLHEIYMFLAMSILFTIVLYILLKIIINKLI